MIVIEARPFDESLEVAISGPPYPFGDELDIDGGMEFSIFGGEISVWMADSEFVTAPDDSPANTHIRAVLLSPFSYEERMFEGSEPAGRTLPGFGDIKIANGSTRDTTGWLDDKLHLGWDGRDIRVYRGQKGSALSTFTLVAKVTCDGLEWDEDIVSFRLRSRQVVFDQELTGPTYGGTGGRDGGAELAGAKVPQAYGRCYNISPALVDATHLVYQVSDISIDDLIDVRDNGVELELAGKVSTYDALISASIAAGKYYRCEPLGLFRLGSAPAGQVTADVLGWVPPEMDVAILINQIIRALASHRLGPNNFSWPSDYDSTPFMGIFGLQFPPLGFYTGTESITVGEIMDQLLVSIGGFWRVRLDGKLTYGQLKSPTGTADYTIEAREILSIRREHYAPSWSQTIHYQRNWTPQPQDGLAGSVTPENRQRFSREHLTIRKEDPNVLSKHRMARSVEVDSLFARNHEPTLVAEMEEEVARRQELYGAERDIYVIEIIGDPFSYELNGLVDITGVTRFGWSDPKKLRIIGRSVDDPGDGFTARVTLRLWG